MADIFISYARGDRECARVLAQSLEQRGWTVWWDREVHAGEDFEEVIEREIDNARATIVLWSESSVKSRFVKAEATRALGLNKLLPVRIDNAPLPLRFTNIHTTDLSAWLAPSKSGGRIRGSSEAARNAAELLVRDLKHHFAVRPSVEPEDATEGADDRPPEPRQQPTARAPANEFRWDERQHGKTFDTFGIVEDDDWVVVKMPPQLRDDVGGTRTVVKKGLVAPKPT
ncbi:MAG TPA: toll/interleukin-1 receptor domain-containing protein [Xanthobacteraceae bacterium]|jgi:hypothetical protein